MLFTRRDLGRLASGAALVLADAVAQQSDVASGLSLGARDFLAQIDRGDPVSHRGITNSPVWARLRPDDRMRVLEVLRAAQAFPDPTLNSEGQRALRETMSNVLALLQSPDRVLRAGAQGRTTLDHLYTVATQEIGSVLIQISNGDARTPLLRGLLRGLARPNLIHQGNAPNGAGTSIQRALSVLSPGEVARLAAELSGPSGQAMLRRGDLLTLPLISWNASADGRNLWDFVFQTAGLQAAKALSPSVAPQPGISALQACWLESQLFGMPYEPWMVVGERELAWQALRSLGDGASKPALFLTLDPIERSSNPEDVRVSQRMQFLSFLRGARALEDRVVFWCPESVLRDVGLQTGQTVRSWRIENGDEGIFSLDRAEFARQVSTIDFPVGFPIPSEARGRFADFPRRMDVFQRQRGDALEQIRRPRAALAADAFTFDPRAAF